MKIIILILVCFLISCSQQDTEELYVAERLPQKIASFQIQEGSKTLGYAHKYEWEDSDGDLQYHYFIHNSLGEMIGYVGETGTTESYSPTGESQYLGEYTLEEAASKIFDTQGSIRVLTVQAEDVKEIKSIVISSQGDSFSPSRRKTGKPRIYKEYIEEDDKDNEKDNDKDKDNEKDKDNDNDKDDKKDKDGSGNLEEWPDSDEKWPGEE